MSTTNIRTQQTQLLDLEAFTELRFLIRSGPSSEHLYCEWELLDTRGGVVLDSGVKFWHRSTHGIRNLVNHFTDVFRDNEGVLGVDMHQFNLDGSGDPF